MVRCAWGSRSIRQTRLPSSARAAPRLVVVVVLPTPPFWFISAMIRMIRLRAKRLPVMRMVGPARRANCAGSRADYKPHSSIMMRADATNTMPTLDEILQTAVAHHQAGRYPQAEQLYRQILTVQPNEPTTLQLLGVLAHHVGQNQAAIELINRA